MPRSLSNNAVRAMMAQETSEVFLELLTINEDSLAQPVRVVNNGEDIVSNGETYTSCPFSIILPADEDNFISEIQLSIENVTRQLVPIVRQAVSTPTIDYQIVLASSPDTVEIELLDFTLQNVSYDANTMTATFGQESFLSEPYPGNIFAPSVWPGLV